ncbi:AIPR family protein [Lusitaniella coriacea LEGE 07157]|uniref:AIPR family protein n=1 Tax=Lusitaniella coriacea LEGE 07157 TaxID=945747 RepID=A0A8J7B3X2_9CYAN|nr:AIPR family protein [Lusitaniella coriacea]MBE9115412.1 AIPR family protein [Lusitaniella coriacea LEGE 07157]
MSKHTFDWIERQVCDIASERSVQPDRAFAVWCMQFIYPGFDLDEALIRTDTLRGYGGGDGGLDGWYKNEDIREFHLWQCKWSESFGKVFDKKPALELKNALEELLSLERASQYGDKFVEVATSLQLAMEHDYQIILNIGLLGSMKENSISQFNKTICDFAREKELKISCEVWDLEKFQQEYEEHHPSSETLEGQSFKFKLKSSQIIHMDFDDATLPQGWEVVVASLQGISLGKLAQQLASKLFGLNVRFALGANKRIKSIWESLVDPTDSQYFWLYNNGLTILCDDFKITNDSNGIPNAIIIENPQVVNGCQTVTAFKKCTGKYTDKPSVLARIIKPPSNSEGKKKSLLIAEKTNSQNPVLSRDLRSNDTVQKRLRKSFDQLNPPWFYERKRGEWGTLKTPEKNKYKDNTGEIRGSHRRLDMEYLGQAWRMLEGFPSVAITQKRELFDNEEIYSKVFSPRRNPEQFLFASRLRTKYEEFWHGKNFEGIRSTCGNYLTDSMLRRMMNAKGQVVSHSVALTCKALKKGKSWELSDAKIGLKLIDNFESKLLPWNRILAKAFHEMLQALDNDEEAVGFKKTLEKSDGNALKTLWSSIEATASILSFSDEKLNLPRDILLREEN